MMDDVILLQPGSSDFFGGGYSGFRDEALNAIADQYQINLGLCLPLSGVSQSMHQNVSPDPRQPPRISGAPALAEISITKPFDRYSLALNDYCLSAKPLGQGRDQPTLIYIIHVGADQVAEVSTIALRDALISGLQFQATTGGQAAEQFLLNFTEVIWTFESKPSEAKRSFGWSQLTLGSIAQFSS